MKVKWLVRHMEVHYQDHPRNKENWEARGNCIVGHGEESSLFGYARGVWRTLDCV
jgi:hypothetical protein